MLLKSKFFSGFIAQRCSLQRHCCFAAVSSSGKYRKGWFSGGIRQGHFQILPRRVKVPLINATYIEMKSKTRD